MEAETKSQGGEALTGKNFDADECPKDTTSHCCINQDISTFQGINKRPTGATTWQEALKDLRSDKYKRAIERVRVVLHKFGCESAEYRKVKIELPAVTFGGTFAPHRAKVNVTSPTGIIIPDLDHLDERTEIIFRLLTQDENVWFLFRSPSGEGLKVGFRAQGIKCDEDHKQFYFAVEQYFKEIYGIKIDPACKDISRLTFVSHDPELWISDDPQYFDISRWSKPLPLTPPPVKPPAFINTTGKQKYAMKVLESCCEKILQSLPGDQHQARLKAARYIGGYLQYIDETEVISELEQAVQASGVKRMSAAMKTIKDGLAFGKTEPITIPDIEPGQSHTGQVETPDDLLNFEIKEKPHLDITKFSGITKAFVELATRNSEADPAAVIGTFLARFGVEVGRNPFFMVGDTVHHGRLDCVVVGDSSKSRKGTSEKPVNSLFSLNSLPDSEKQGYKPARTSPGPFSSGEGVIYKVRDQVESWNTKEQKTETTDPGVTDKRLYICDEEFNNVLANVKREGNTLSMVIRKAWDDGTFEPLTKNSRMSATNAHIGWVCHITGYELQAKLSECEGFNGFANRILWIFAQRQKLVPLPEPMPTKELAEIQYLLLSILNKCHEHEKEIPFTEQAQEAWVNKYYRQLTSQNETGLLGVVLSRSEAQVRRLALLFTLLDGEYETSLKHLDQAMTVWKYCEDSASYIFKGQAQDSVARKISQTLQEKGQLTGTEIRDLFSRNVKKDRIEKAIQELVTSDTAEMVLEPTKGRPLNILKMKCFNDINDINDKRSENGVDERLKSFKSFKSLRGSDKKPVGQEFKDLGAGCSDVDEDI
jgi:hypothetical protein